MTLFYCFQQIYNRLEIPSICSAITSAFVIWSQGLKKAPLFSLQTGFTNCPFASKVQGFYSHNDYDRNEDLTKQRGWTTKNMTCSKKAYEPLLMAFTESLLRSSYIDVNAQILHYKLPLNQFVYTEIQVFKTLDVTVSGYTLLSGVLMTMWQKTTKHSSRKLESLQCSRKYHGSNPKLVLTFHPSHSGILYSWKLAKL